MRPSAQPFLWKWVLFAWEWKIISISKAEHLTSFWYRGPGELGNGLLYYNIIEAFNAAVNLNFIFIACAQGSRRQCLRDVFFLPHSYSLLLRRFVFGIAEASAKRVTGDEPQGTMGRVQTSGYEAVTVMFLWKDSPTNDVWETSAEIPYWWRVTTQV